LILDEPTSGLDPVARREFLEIVQHQARQHHRTTFFSSHLVEEVERVADRVGIIHNGRLRYEGTVETLHASVREVVYDEPSGAADEASIATLREQLLQRMTAHGLTYLRDGLNGRRSLLLRGELDQWTTAPVPPCSIRSLSLEDIFIALASEVPRAI
jgi:ABC-2 type transport system ATP-binding protein